MTNSLLGFIGLGLMGDPMSRRLLETDLINKPKLNKMMRIDKYKTTQTSALYYHKRRTIPKHTKRLGRQVVCPETPISMPAFSRQVTLMNTRSHGAATSERDRQRTGNEALDTYVNVEAIGTAWRLRRLAKPAGARVLGSSLTASLRVPLTSHRDDVPGSRGGGHG